MAESSFLDDMVVSDDSADEAAETAAKTTESKEPEKTEAIIVTPEELESARQEAAEAKAKLAELQATLGEEIKNMRAERQAEKAKAEEPPKAKAPDFLSDPEGNVNFKLTQKEEEFTRALTDLRGKSEEDRNLLLTQLLLTRTQQTEMAFASTQPDYQDALNYTRAMRAKELQLFDAPSVEIPKIINQEEMALAARALQNGKNPAQVAYERAKALGYSMKQDTEIPQKSAEVTSREERRERAQSMGGGGSPNLSDALDADTEEGFREAFKELTGVELR